MERRAMQQELVEGLHRLKRLVFSGMHGPMSRGEFFMLDMLGRCRIADPDGEGMYVSDLAGRLRMSPPGVSRMLRALEEKALIERSVDREDRRNTYIRLTAAGEERCRAAQESMHRVMDRVFERMGEEDMGNLLALWKRLVETLESEIQSNDEGEP